MHGFATGFGYHLLDRGACRMSDPGLGAAARALPDQLSRARALTQFPAWHEVCTATGGDWHFSRQGLRRLVTANEENEPLVAI
jgi:hypothetical protein